jgi:hypothetical protein
VKRDVLRRTPKDRPFAHTRLEISPCRRLISCQPSYRGYGTLLLAAERRDYALALEAWITLRHEASLLGVRIGGLV